MSGHSKWSTIKHKKGIKDAKRGNLFTKLAKAITLAAHEGGGDPSMNFTLRLAVDKAKEANMPSDNITRAIKKGTGELQGGEIVRVSYEAYGPSSTALIIDCTTDNTNRTFSEIKNIVETGGGKVADAGSVSWQFEEKGVIALQSAKIRKAEKFGAEDTYESVDSEELMMELMEINGVDDINQSSFDEDGKRVEVLEVTTSRNNFAQVDKTVREKGIKVLDSELAKVAKDKVNLDGENLEKFESFIEKLDEHDDIENVWSNLG